MSKTSACGAVLGVLASLVPAGCDSKPRPPVTADGKTVDRLVLSGDPKEEELVIALETARVNYQYRLEVIRAYYQNIGNIDKLQWSRQEMENLRTAQVFRWEGLKAQVFPPQGESVEHADEMILAEYVVGARKEWQDVAAALQAHYEQKGESFKAGVIRNMRARLMPEHLYTYFLNAEIPGPDLKPTEVIPEAEQLFEQALALYRQGRILPAVSDYKKERQALELFKQLVQSYPRSTRIALSAYYIGEIYKEYFNEDVRAVRWLERAWQWDPAIPLKARFQAAVVWDHRLHNRGKALELYKEVMKHEQFNQSNVAYAQRRIQELTEKN